MNGEIHNLLPAGLDMSYLRQLAAVPYYWEVNTDFTDLGDKVANLGVNTGSRTARILLNVRYFFTRQALARTICHELMELSTIHTWLSFLKLISDVGNQALISEYRRARDAEIEDRLNKIPWFNQFDVAVPRDCVQRLGSDHLVYHT